MSTTILNTPVVRGAKGYFVHIPEPRTQVCRDAIWERRVAFQDALTALYGRPRQEVVKHPGFGCNAIATMGMVVHAFSPKEATERAIALLRPHLPSNVLFSSRSLRAISWPAADLYRIATDPDEPVQYQDARTIARWLLARQHLAAITQWHTEHPKAIVILQNAAGQYLSPTLGFVSQPLLAGRLMVAEAIAHIATSAEPLTICLAENAEMVAPNIFAQLIAVSAAAPKPVK